MYAKVAWPHWSVCNGPDDMRACILILTRGVNHFESQITQASQAFFVITGHMSFRCVVYLQQWRTLRRRPLTGNALVQSRCSVKAYQSFSFTDQSVEQGRLADVRSPNYSNLHAEPVFCDPGSQCYARRQMH